MNRFTAFLTHFGISLVIFAILGYLIVFHWYPGFFFATDGGWQGIRIVALVDLVLGPTLTFAVFKAGKPGLKFDLTMIGCLQAACLAAGTYIVYIERPIAMIFADGYFHSVTADDFIQEAGEIPDLSVYGGSYPKWISVNLPEDYTKQSEVRRQALKDQIPIRMLDDYYKPFEETDIDMERDAFPLAEIRLADQKNNELTRFLAEHGGSAEDYTFIPFGTRYERVLLGLTADGAISGFLTLPAPT